MEERQTKKGGSKFLVGLIAFILGFLFAIIAEIGAIAGICFFVLNTDFDNIFNTLGIPNDDGNGNAYINTDSEAGGAKTVMELVGKLTSMYESIGTVTVSEVKTLFPALAGVTTTIYDSLGAYIELDEVEFEATQFMDLPMYLEDKIMDIRPAKIMATAGMDSILNDNELVHALLAGVECDYVYANPADKENSAKFPLYYDDYVFNSQLAGGKGAYNRTIPVDGADTYPLNLDANLWLSESNKKSDEGLPIYRQYFYGIQGDDGVTYYVTAKDSNGEYVYQTVSDESVIYKKEYGDSYIGATGNYYYDNTGAEVQINAITVRSITEDAFGPLNNFMVTDFLEGDKIIDEIFEGASVGELLDGRLDLDKRVGNLTLPAVMDIDPESPIMVYIGYNVKGLKDNGDGTYTGTHSDGTVVTVYAEDGVITKVTDRNGLEIKGVTVENVPTVVDGAMEVLTISDVMDVKATDAIMSYIGFGVTELKRENGDGYSFVARYKIPAENGGEEREVDCFVVCDPADNIKNVYYLGEGNEKIYIDGTPINAIPEQVEKLTDNVKIKEVIRIDESDKLMSKIGGYTISSVGDAINEIELGEFMDIKSTDHIMTYMAYGASGIKAVDPPRTDYGHTCTIVALDGTERTGYIKEDINMNILGIYYDEALTEPVQGTTINGVADRAERLTSDLTLRDVININSQDSNKILNELADSKICDLSEAINNITLQKIFTDEIYSGTDDNGSALQAAKLYEAVETVTDAATQILFSADYVYYVKDGNSYVLVKGEGNLGKLTKTEFESGVAAGTTYYTYGETKGLWKLMLCTTVPIKDSGLEMKKAVAATATAGDGQIPFNSMYLYYTKVGDNYVLVNSNVEGKTPGKLTLDQFNSSTETYYTYGKGSETVLSNDEQVYTVNDFNKLIAGATGNIKSSSLFELYKAGIIEASALYHTDESGAIDFNKPKKIWQTDIVLGDLTILDALNSVITD